MKNYSRLSIAKLENLLTIATAEERPIIEAEIAKKREAQAAKDKPAEEQPVEEQVGDSVSQAAEEQPVEEQTGDSASQDLRAEGRKKMTDEERDALAEKLKNEVVGHRCQVVPFNTATWVEGVIAGVVADKRTNKVLCAVRTDEGKRIVKVWGSPLLKILEEKVEIVRQSRTRAASAETEEGDWDLEADFNKYVDNVGRQITCVPFNSEDGTEPLVGRILALVPDKRVRKILYRVQIPAPTESNPEATRLIHKVASSTGFTIAESFDEVGEALNKKYVERHATLANRKVATPEERVLACKELVEKAEKALEQAKARLEQRKADLEQAEKELAEASAKEGEKVAEELNAVAEAPEAGQEQENASDLM